MSHKARGKKRVSAVITGNRVARITRDKAEGDRCPNGHGRGRVIGGTDTHVTFKCDACGKAWAKPLR